MNKNISQNYVEVAGKILAVSFGIKMVNITLTIIILVVKKNVQWICVGDLQHVLKTQKKNHFQPGWF